MIVEYSHEGNITRIIQAPAAEAMLHVPSGLYVLTEDMATTDTTHYVDTAISVIVPFPPAPGEGYRWSWESKTWVEDVDKLRDYKLSEVETHKAYHLSRSYDNILLAPETREQLTSLFIRLLAGLGLPPDWRGILDADGNYQLVGATTAQIKAELGLILTGAEDRAYATRANAEDLRAALVAAVTIANLNAIDVTVGWPA